MVERRKRTVLVSLSFQVIAISAFLTRQTTIPNGPWEGMYSTFNLVWMMLAVSAVLLVAISERNWVRIVGAVLIVATISLMTLQWGTVFGIRDAWIHLGHVHDGNYVRASRYPAFHSMIESLTTITNVSSEILLSRASFFAGCLGVIILAAVASSIKGKNLEIGSIVALTFFPVMIIDFNDRPITFAAILVLTLILLTIVPLKRRMKIVCLIVSAIAALLYHPLVFLLFLLFAGSTVVWRDVSVKTNRLSSIIGVSPQYLSVMTRSTFIVMIGTIFVSYFFYLRPLGQQIAANTILALLYSGAGESAESGGGSTAIIYDIPMYLQETIAMAAIVIIMGLLSVTGFLLSQRDSEDRFISLVAISAAGCLVGIFIVVDLLSPSDFPAIRAVPLASILLSLGAIIGLYHLKKTFKIATPLLIAIVLIGLVVMFPSPLTGTFQQSSTSSDIDRTEWIVENKGDEVIIEAENTYEITHAKYGSSEVDRLANGDVWNHKSTTRSESYPWQVNPSNNGALVVNHELTRLNAEHDGVRWQSEDFEYRSNKVYTNGNSDIFWI